ncbi:MAG: ABC transporter ATP-binding protein [Candidatus Poribacteria bacterium]
MRRKLEAVIEMANLSKWYGQVIGVNDITLSIKPGVTGLLGPNGAGKTTLLKLMAGQLKPSRGNLTVFGEPVWNNPKLYHRIGFCPEQDAFYDRMSGFQFVFNLALLTGYSRSESEARAVEAIKLVDMLDAKDKKIGAYSKGMRQRIKLAQALVHEPELLFLDEPLSGMDAIIRPETINLIKELSAKGKTVIVSSHILHEIEAMTNNILLINHGRILAEGDVHEIRELIDEHPHNVYISCDKPRLLASILINYEDVVSVKFDAVGSGIVIETIKPEDFYSRLPSIILENDIKVKNLHSPDDNLQAVFQYLVK